MQFDMKLGGYFAAFFAVLLGGLSFAIRPPIDLTCDTRGYAADRYLATCSGPRFGDFEHGAFYYELIDLDAARRAEVIFLGNSRTQIAFSTSTVNDFFKRQNVPFYLLGFSGRGGSIFAEKIIDKLGLKPRLIVITADPFFSNTISAPARQVLKGGSDVAFRYWLKQALQPVHRLLGPLLMREKDKAASTVFRSTENGFWYINGRYGRANHGTPIDWNRRSVPKESEIESAIAQAPRLLEHLKVPSGCIVLTAIPNAMSADERYAQALSEHFNLPLIYPRIPGLRTADRSHLALDSAEVWSRKFVVELAPYVDRCVRNAGQEARHHSDNIPLRR